MKDYQSVIKVGVALVALCCGLFGGGASAEVSSHTNAQFQSKPVNLSGSDVNPLVMINASRDHQLSYKAYNDFSDLDGDGVAETTYKDSINYYGYFDSAKCYAYNGTYDRFVPAAMAGGTNKHHCNLAGASGQWSGNFLNWASMTRMDVVRKMLYGGYRSTDQWDATNGSLTVLERQYLPTDAHAFAKYYNGTDYDKYTPFTSTDGVTNSPLQDSSTSNITIPNHVTGEQTLTFTSNLPVNLGDQVKAFVNGSENTLWMIGGVSAIPAAGQFTISVPAYSYLGTATSTNWILKNLSSTGISFANLTKGGSGVNELSQTNTNPPTLRVAKGNFALWGANERFQCYWFDEKNHLQSGFGGGFRSNGNRALLSGIEASAENPSQTTHGLGRSGSVKGEYTVRIEVANPSWLGSEKYKQYGSSFKPIGLLQVYGDDDQISFGLMTGTYDKNVSGGVLRKRATSFQTEVSATDGTFISGANGIVHNLNKIRLYGYRYSDGGYMVSDTCTYQKTGFVLTGGDNNQGTPANQGNCSSWGNPMSEVFLESLRYLAGKTANTTDFGAGTKDSTLGLTVVSWADPLTTDNYCAPLNVLNFNASVSNYDDNQMGGIVDLGSPAPASTAAFSFTNEVGLQEKINLSNWFVGGNGVSANDLCSSKDIGSGFGYFAGICPEAPTQKGTYLMSGVAHYANTERIRTNPALPASRANSRDYKVSTYGIALATNVPKIEITTSSNKKVTILPAYRLDVGGKFGGGTLVDFKIVKQTATEGVFYVNWEDSEMGGDYDQDVWGTIKYSVSGDSVTVTTDTVSASTANGQGFGYVISGTNRDGAHFHSGILDFDFTDSWGDVPGCINCKVGDLPTFFTYTATGSTAQELKDPLWYTAKYGGFTDSNTNKKPDLVSEWDEVNNSTGVLGGDGVPDNFFYATNPLQLESALNRVFLDILKRASSGTAAAVVSNNVSGLGALYQAYYEPLRQDAASNSVSWIGTVQALWLDNYGYLREDGNSDAILDNYTIDPVVQQFFDTTDNKTKVRRYASTKTDEFAPHYMLGKVTSYSALTGAVEFKVEEISGGGTFNVWTVSNLSTKKTGTSSSTQPIGTVGSTAYFTVSPSTFSWFTVGDYILAAHFEYTTVALESLRTLWNARKSLNFATADPTVQRSFNKAADDTSDGGRHIKTWIDSNSNGIVDSGEYDDFTAAKITVSNFPYLNMASETDAENLVDYVRGKEIGGYRNRTIDYDGSGAKVMRLGDIVNSTPTVVGEPQENLHLLYKDDSYGVFKKKYAKRRQVLYVGGNDGMLHAFNGGFYEASAKRFNTSGKKYDGSAAIAHPLGSELWAYVPYNLLPHLKWLKEQKYVHVYYVDGKPKVFDAKIFDPTDPDHPGGWGTVLVVGMRFGGGPMTVDVDNVGTKNVNFSSAYIIMDITNPEAEPDLLAEIQIPDGSYTTSYPMAFTLKDKVNASPNKWFLGFGNGPNLLGTAESTQSAKFYVFDFDQLKTPGTQSVPTGCAAVDVPAVGTGTKMKIMQCDIGTTDAPNSFVGDPISVDWNLDYKADDVYFGVVGNKNSNSGRVMRFSINNDSSPTTWTKPVTLTNTAQPVVSAVTPAFDNKGKKWIFFGTGRFFVSDDQDSKNPLQSIYGVKDEGSTVSVSDLLDVSSAKVKTDGTFEAMVGTSNNIKALETEIETSHKGWKVHLPPIIGTALSVPATRVINASALAGGVLFTAAYQPGSDKCTGEGQSRLYGLYYKTGTAYPNPAALGTQVVGVVEYANSYRDLGSGFATSPSLHSGTGSGDKAVSVFSQLSTGAVERIEGKTVHSIRSGMTSWIEPR